MSYTVNLEHKGEGRLVLVTRHAEGGTRVGKTLRPDGDIVPGTTDASLSVTYNYRKIFIETFEMGLPDLLSGRVAEDCIPHLERGVLELGTEQSGKYWDATKGNVGYVLGTLLDWAKQHPKAIFTVY